MQRSTNPRTGFPFGNVNEVRDALECGLITPKEADEARAELVAEFVAEAYGPGPRAGYTPPTFNEQKLMEARRTAAVARLKLPGIKDRILSPSVGELATMVFDLAVAVEGLAEVVDSE